MMTREGERQAYERDQFKRASESVIRATFALLPPVGEVFPEYRRSLWLAAIEASLRFIYAEKVVPADALVFQEGTMRILRAV